jgi:multidrug efflux pump subunit AcrA (membrane-fusion protein)
MSVFRFARVGGVAAAVSVLAATAACSKSSTAQARGGDAAPASVQAQTVREEVVRRSVDIVGTLAAADQVVVSSETDGTVSRILADLGDRVTAGQPLVELDREKRQYSLDQQRATLARALASYGASEPGKLPPIEQTPDVKKAQAELQQARQNFERTQTLQQRQLVAQQLLDDAQATLQAKQAGYDAALQNAKNLQAQIDAADASLKLADRQLRDTFIRAPFDGYVQERVVSLGELVKAQAPVMKVVRIDPLKVTAEIPERMAPWIKTGAPVDLNVDAYGDRTFKGTLSRISPAVNTQTRAFPFEARVPNTDSLLKPGTFARVHIETAQQDKIVTVPYAALQYRYGVNRVFVVDGDKLAVRELKTGDRLGDRIEVLSGVTAGEQIAVSDVEKLVDGMKVKVGPAQSTPAPAAKTPADKE